VGKSVCFVMILGLLHGLVSFAQDYENNPFQRPTTNQPMPTVIIKGTKWTDAEKAAYDADEAKKAQAESPGPTAEEQKIADINNCPVPYDHANNRCPSSQPAATTPVTNSASSLSVPAVIEDNCLKDATEAVEQCNFGGNKEAQLAVGMANNMRQQIKAMSMASPALMCSKMGSVSQSIDVAVAAFSGYCTTAYTTCESSCSASYEELKTKLESTTLTLVAKDFLETQLSGVRSARKKCASLAGNVKNVFENVGSYAAIEQAKSQYCGEKTDALAELCKSQPGNVLCKTAGGANCADPNVAASSIVCICQVNRNDPRCGAQAAVGLQSGLNGNSRSNGAGADGGKDALADFGGLGGDAGGGGFDANSLKGSAGEDGPNARPRSGVGGGRASLDGGGGGQNKGAGGAGGGAAGNAINAKIIAGYGAGGAGAAGRSYGSAGAAGSGAGAPGRNGYGSGTAGGKPGVDLRKFLPGGQMDPSRGLAGAAGPDGITGPNSDIWKKIQMRYYSVSPSLLP